MREFEEFRVARGGDDEWCEKRENERMKKYGLWKKRI